MELRHLRYFVVAAEEENFSRAAERLSVDQSALSRRVHDLEDELGFQLFDRQSKRVRLSSAGRAYFEDARRILGDIDLAGVKSRRIARGETGVLGLGINTTVLRREAVARALSGFRAANPGVELKLDPITTMPLTEAVLGGRVDAAFLYTRPEDGALFDHVHVDTDEFLVALPRGHALAAGGTPKLADLAGESFLWMKPEDAPGVHDRLLAACRAGGLEPRIVQHVTSESARLELVAAGMGISFVTSPFREYSAATVVVRALVDLRVTLQLDLMWRQDNRSPILERFIALCREVLCAGKASIAEAI